MCRLKISSFVSYLFPLPAFLLVGSWFISPALSGILSSALYLIVDHSVLRRVRFLFFQSHKFFCSFLFDSQNMRLLLELQLTKKLNEKLKTRRNRTEGLQSRRDSPSTEPRLSCNLRHVMPLNKKSLHHMISGGLTQISPGSSGGGRFSSIADLLWSLCHCECFHGHL